ncbi:hypothetical protein VIGAN_04340400 [Vigna angularis var. angularis]|uniref:Uncharacterized protein n=1 Tax=Vigna angularis var. angularis TaxID=157739 RepID=A0A0S3RZ07_PHAAN|nr:hypothetical protein VIGAN_04340400 [Vigna angularis var. angularis]
MVVSTYQAASGAGAAAMEELELQTREYAFNLFSHNASVLSNGYNEETKMSEKHKWGRRGSETEMGKESRIRERWEGRRGSETETRKESRIRERWEGRRGSETEMRKETRIRERWEGV